MRTSFVQGDWDDITTPGLDEAIFHELRGGVSGTAGTHDCLSTSFFVLKHHALLRLAPQLGLAVHAPATAENGGTAEVAAQAAAVGALLMPSGSVPSGSAGGGIPVGGGSPSWAEVEVGLWALGAVAKDAVRVLTSPLSREAAGVEQRVVQQQALGSTLMGLLMHVVSQKVTHLLTCLHSLYVPEMPLSIPHLSLFLSSFFIFNFASHPCLSSLRCPTSRCKVERRQLNFFARIHCC